MTEKEKREFLKKIMPYGMIKEVAEELGHEPNYISRVVNGKISSAPVWAVIEMKIENLYQRYSLLAA